MEQDGDGFMEYDPNLDFWDQPRLLRGLLSILGVSAVMIWVEVLFHRFVLLPEGNAAVKNQIRCAHKSLDKPIDEMSEEELKEAFGDDIAFSSLIGISGSIGTDKASLLGLYNLENMKLDKANKYAYLSMFIPFFVVLFLMYRVYYKLKQDRYKHHYIPVFGGYAMEGVALSVFLSVLLFLGFQIVFYLYGLEFNFADGLELSTELREYADQELFSQYIPQVLRSIFGDGKSTLRYQNLVNYESGPIELPSSWSEDQTLYPKALDTSIKNLDPFVSDVGAFFNVDLTLESGSGCNPWNTDEYCKDKEYKKYSALWQAQYQTKVGGPFLESLRKDYCTPQFWETKYPEFRTTQIDEQSQAFRDEIITGVFYPSFWSEEQRQRYKSSTRPMPASNRYRKD